MANNLLNCGECVRVCVGVCGSVYLLGMIVKNEKKEKKMKLWKL